MTYATRSEFMPAPVRVRPTLECLLIAILFFTFANNIPLAAQSISTQATSSQETSTQSSSSKLSSTQSREKLQDDSAVEQVGPFQLRQVFVPESDLSILGDNFVPTDRKKLVELINEFRTTGDSNDHSQLPFLSESIYIAKLVGQDLVSEYSRWSVVLNGPTSKTWILPETSIAWHQIEKLRSTDPDKAFVPIQFRPNGEAECFIQDPTTSIEFAWSASGKSMDSTSDLHFSLQLPPSSISRTMVELPPGWSIASTTNIVSKIGELQSQLPSDWPQTIAKEYGDGNWWLLLAPVSGNLVFSIEKESDGPSLPYNDIINRQYNDYYLTSQGLELTTRSLFDIRDDRNPQSNQGPSLSRLTLSVDPRLGIREVLVNNRLASWKSGNSENTIVIENADLSADNINRPTQVTVNAITDWPIRSDDVRLPSIDWKGPFVVEGITTVHLSNEWKATTFKSSSGQVSASHDSTALETLNKFDIVWQGVAPEINFNAIPRVSNLSIDVLTRLTNSNEGFTTVTRALLPKGLNQQGSIWIEAENGWTVDSVQALDSTISTSILRSTKGKGEDSLETTLYEISVSPSASQSTIDLEIIAKRGKSVDINKPSPLNPVNDNNLYFKSCQPIRIRNYKQNDIYVIESTGRYTIDASPGLIEYRVPDDQIPNRYLSMLPRMGDFWLIKPDLGRLPSMTFRRQAAPYTSEIETSIQFDGSALETRHQIRCIPVAGAVSTVVLSFPNGEMSALKWRFRPQSTTDDWLPMESINLESKKSSEVNTANADGKSNMANGPQRYRLMLPRSMTVPFEMEAIQFHAIGQPIDFPNTPEATQVRARVELDSTIEIADKKQQANESRFQPQGDWVDPFKRRFSRYQYIPSQVFRLEVRKRTLSESGWISQLHTIQNVYPEGTRTAEFHLDLHQIHLSEFNFTLPPAWTIRNAYLNGDQPVPFTFKDSTNRTWTILIPKERMQPDEAKGLSLKISLDGPPIALQDGQPLDWPILSSPRQTLNANYSISLPDGFNVIENDISDAQKESWLNRFSDFGSSNMTSRLSFGNWLQRMSESFNFTRTASQPVDVLDPSQTRLNATTKQNNLIFVTIIVVAFISFLVGGWSLKALVAAIGIMIIVIPVGPSVAIDWIYASLVAVSVAILLHAVKHLVYQLPAVSPTTMNVASKSLKQLTQFLMPIGLVLSATWEPLAFGQSPARVDNVEENEREPFYSVIFPIDEEGQLTGDIAYVGEALLKLLNRRSNASSTLNYVVSAKHELAIDSSLEETFRDPSCKVTCRYEWNIQDISKALIIPLPNDYRSILSVKIDGIEQSLGTRIQALDSNLIWQHTKRGKAEIEVSFRCALTIDVRNQISLRIPVLPIANTIVNIVGQNITDLKIDSAGQTTNPSIGRYSIAFGKGNEIYLRWRQNLSRSSVRTIKSDVDIEWALMKEQSIAKCKIGIEGEWIDASKFEIECEQPWEPIGLDWGDGKVFEIVAGSTNLKKRFRIQWKDGLETTNRRLEFFVRRAESKSPAILNPPVIEIGGARIESRTITVAQSSPGEWEMNRTNTWNPLPRKSQLDWLSTSFLDIQSLRTIDPSATVSLNRKRSIPQPEISAVGNLLFQSNSVYGTTDFAFTNSSPVPAELIFSTPHGTTIQSIQAGDRDVPFLEEILENGKRIAKVITDGSFSKSRSIRVKFSHSYSTNSQWRNLPKVTVSNVKSLSYEVSVNTLIDLPIEFDGVEKLILSNKQSAATALLTSNEPILSANPAERVLDPVLPFTLFQRKRKSATEMDSALEDLSLHPYRWTVRLPSTDIEEVEIASDNQKESVLGETVRYRILASLPEMQGHLISTMSVSGSTWNFKLTGSVTRKIGDLGGCLFDVPAGIADSMRSNNQITEFESSEAGRRLVLISNMNSSSSTKNSSLNTEFSFAFECELEKQESTTGLSLPLIRLLNGPSVEHWLVVPKTTANQPLTWTTSGVRQFRPSSIPSVEPEFQSNDLLWFQPVSSQPEIRLNVLQTRARSASILSSFYRVKKQSSHTAKVESYFLIDPNGTSYISLHIPNESTALEILVNDEEYLMEAKLEKVDQDSNLIKLPLQSSVLPQFVKNHFDCSTCKCGNC